jgi:hypothetical protein
VRARLAIFAAVGGLALTGAPEALADPDPSPSPVAPVDGAVFTARADQITFQASTDAIQSPGRIDFYISKVNETGSDGVLSSPIDTFFAGPNADVPPIYEAGPGSDANWPNKPNTYYWQAVYHNCDHPNCFSAIRSLTIDPLAPPTQTSPEDDATIPYGGEATFSVQDVPSYTRDGTHINIEFSKGTELSPDGTFAHQYLLAWPSPVGEGVYDYQGTELITERPATYYWIVERFDCSAEADCDVTDGQIRSFTVAPPVAGVRRTPSSPTIHRVERTGAESGSHSPPASPALPSGASIPAAGPDADRRRGSGTSNRAVTGSRFERSPTARGIQPPPRGCSGSFAATEATNLRGR